MFRSTPELNQPQIVRHSRVIELTETKEASINNPVKAKRTNLIRIKNKY